MEFAGDDCVGEVQAAVCACLAREGLTVVERMPFQPPGVGRMGLALVDGFVATVDVLAWLDEGDDDVCDRWSARAALGLDYTPAREITAALTGYVHSGVLLREPSLTADAADERDVPHAVQELVRFALAETPGLARFANVDALVDLLRADRAVPASDGEFLLSGSEPPSPDSPKREDATPLLIAALLASAGEHERALPVLAELQYTARSERRLVRQLTRFVAPGDALALPTSAPEWPPQWLRRKLEGGAASPGVARIEIEGMSEAAVLEQAIKAVRSLDTDKTRAELRQSLVAELGGSAAEVTPVQVERAVERLVAERGLAGKAGGVLGATAALKELVEARGAATERSSDDLGDEALWELPEQAAFPIRPSAGRRVAVQLNAAARQFFDRTAATLAHVWDGVNLNAWFTHDEEHSAEPAGMLAVHVGQQLVGWLDCAFTSCFEATLEAAAQRAESPYVGARLTRIPDQELAYILDLALPEEMLAP